MIMITACRPRILLLIVLIKLSGTAPSVNEVESDDYWSVSKSGTTGQKLVIILVDGFRWDYFQLHKDKLPGLRQFLKDGVAAEYVEPVFPSLSLPCWTTLVTGLYPAHHHIVDNHMIHLSPDPAQPDLIFNFGNTSSHLEFWWQDAEPLWITATKQGHKVFLSDFSRCDVPFHGLHPAECTGYNIKNSTTLSNQLRKVIHRFQHNFSLALVYDGWVDLKTHKFGPNSDPMLEALKTVDVALQEFLYNLKLYKLDKVVNVVITGDHGGTDIRKSMGTKYVPLKKYLRTTADVHKIISYGPLLMIATEKGQTDAVYQRLKLMPGVDAYKKADIPEELHIKEGKYVQDILLMARPGYSIMGLHNEKQLPQGSWKVYSEDPMTGMHGYWNMTDMRTVFYARGPAFKRGGVVLPPIGLEDQYQIFARVLGLKPMPNNGTWTKVSGLLANDFSVN